MSTFNTWKTINFKDGKLSDQLSEELFTFEMNEDGKPIKLGDGTYGIVYQVKPVNSEESYALKLFYSRELSSGEVDIDQKNATQARFLLEFKYIDNIRKKWKFYAQNNTTANKNFKPKGIIKPYAATAEFLSSEAYNNLFREGDLKNIKVENYAIVLPLYDGTLKDLLETKGENNLTGYDVLKKAEFNLRIIAMLPILKELIYGLKTLYIGDYKHLDIKPANIFYQEDGSIQFVLADMGYLNTKGKAVPANQTLMTEEKDIKQLLGTRHYRSPEQIDYFDKCDTKVEVDENNVTLKISDPKFEDSIIEKNDVLFFSKSEKRFTYDIEEYLPTSKENGFVTLKIIANPDKEIILPEDKTQIEFRKRQSIKTDLFGVAAVAYDLLTAGKSPERFYERIRNLDTEKEDINSIIQRYKKLKAYKKNDQEIQHIFEPMKMVDKYPDLEIVEFILKCMLYNVKDTYAHICNKQEQYKIFDIILEDLDKILNAVANRVKYERALKVTLELLFKKNDTIINEKNFRKEGNLTISKVLDELVAMKNDHFFWRLASGIKHLHMLAEYIQKTIFQSNGRDSYYFAEIYPENLFINQEENKLQANDIAYEEETVYLDDISKDKVLTKIHTDPTDFFVPESISFIHRQIRIKVSTGQVGSQLKCKYDFLSKSYLGEELKKGDWVVYQKKGIPQCLYKVISVNLIEEEMILERYDSNQDKTLDIASLEKEIIEFGEDTSVEVIYYHNIDRLKYYLQLLGTYVQHLFFAGHGKSNRKTIPKTIKLIQNKIIEGYSWKLPIQENPITDIYYQLANLYAKLILVNDENSFYHKFKIGAKDELKIITDLTTEIEKLQFNMGLTLFDAEGFIKSLPYDLLRSVSACEDDLKKEVASKHQMNEINFESILADILVTEKTSIGKGKQFLFEIQQKFKRMTSKV